MKHKILFPLVVLAVTWGGTPALRAERTLFSVPTRFRDIARHGDPLGWHLGVASDPDVCRHYQGIVRVDSAAGTPHFILTRSGNNTGFQCTPTGACGTSDCPGEIAVVQMASRPAHGERLRSNKLLRNAKLEDTIPSTSDTGVRSYQLNGSGGWPAYRHPGGGQVIDGILIVPLEEPFGSETALGALLLVDVADPLSLQPIKKLTFTFKIGVFGVTRDPATGKYLFLLTGGDNSVVRFYETDQTSLRDPQLSVSHVDDWLSSELATASWLPWQTMQIIRQSNNQLFVACASNESETAPVFNGRDIIRLFQLDRTGNNFSFSFFAERHLKLDGPGMGNLNAGSGFHITPTGQLILYTVEHDNDGPGGTVRAGEFRSVAEPPSCGGWIEFYVDDNGWENSATLDRSVILDLVDRDLENWNDLHWESFGTPSEWNDNFDSVRWNLPPGQSVTFYDNDNFGGSSHTVTGSGSIGRLDDIGLGDKITSVRFNNLSPDTSFANVPGHASTVGGGLAVLRTCPTPPTGLLRVSAGNYPENLRIDKPVRIINQTASPSTVRIGQ